MSEQEALELLETEWADHKSVWSMLLKWGKTPTEVLEFLESFA